MRVVAELVPSPPIKIKMMLVNIHKFDNTVCVAFTQILVTYGWHRAEL